MNAVLPMLWPVALLAACTATVPPPARVPTVSVMPGKRQSFEQFLLDEPRCRRHAAAQGGQAGAPVLADSAVAGTLIGAATGALLGGHRQAAANGAVAGLLAGVVSGQRASQDDEVRQQYQYNLAYQQCMVAKGHTVETASSAAWRSGHAPPWYVQPAAAPAQQGWYVLPVAPANAPPPEPGWVVVPVPPRAPLPGSH